MYWSIRLFLELFCPLPNLSLLLFILSSLTFAVLCHVCLTCHGIRHVLTLTCFFVCVPCNLFYLCVCVQTPLHLTCHTRVILYNLPNLLSQTLSPFYPQSHPSPPKSLIYPHPFLWQSPGGSQPGLPAIYFPGQRSAFPHPVPGDCVERERLPAGQEWKCAAGMFSGQGLHSRQHQPSG